MAKQIPISNDDPREKVRRVFGNMRKLYEENRDTFPRNVLLVGQPAAGKSSLINLFRSACKGEYANIAAAGSPGVGADDSVTEHILFYPSMGLNPDEEIDFKERFQFGSDFCLPTLIDMPGIKRNNEAFGELDEDKIHEQYKKNLRNVFKYMIDGIVPDQAEISSALSGQQVLARKDFSKESRDRLKIDRVIFVVSLTQDIDEELLKVVMEIISNSHGERKVIPHMAIFTHSDCIGDKEDQVTEETAKRRRQTAAGILKTGNNMKLNSHDVINYNDDQDPTDEDEDYRYQTNLEKHIIGIRAFCKLCTRRRIIDDKPCVTSATEFWDSVDRCMTWCRRKVWALFKLLVYVIVFLGIVAVVQQIIKNGPPINSTKDALKLIWNVTQEFIMNGLNFINI